MPSHHDTYNDTINVHVLIQAASTSLDPLALGKLIACISDEVYRGSRRRTFQLLVQNSLLPYLFQQPEFIEGIEKKRLKTSKLIKVGFRYNPQSTDAITSTTLSSSVPNSSSPTSSLPSPSTVIHNLALLMGSNALNIFSSSAIDALHTGILHWQSLHYSIEASAKLLIALLSELSTYDEVGLFLSLFTASSFIIQYNRHDLIELLYRVLAHPDIRDLGGNRKDLYKYLDDYTDELHEFMRNEGKTNWDDDSENSDADSQGNLDGFVVYSEEEEDDSGEGSEDSDSDDGSEDSDRDDGSGSDTGSTNSRPQRKSTKRTKTDTNGSNQRTSTNTNPNTTSTTAKRKRLQRTIHKESKNDSDNDTVSSIETDNMKNTSRKKTKMESSSNGVYQQPTTATNRTIATKSNIHQSSTSSSSSNSFSKYYDFDAFQ